MYERLLLPTDGNKRTRTVPEQAITIAKTYDAKLYVLHAVDTDRFPGTTQADLRNVLAEEGQAAIDRFVNLAKDRGIDAEGVCKDGRPVSVILEFIETADIDLVVMGTHGRSGIERMVLGSVTERIIRTSPCPVLSVDLSREATAVNSKSAAIETAREAIDSTNETVEELSSDPYQEYGTWIVPIRTATGDLYNVHIAADTGQARLARRRE
ncbi:MAG: universal stress protein [Halobacteriales archaeon]